MQKIKFSSQAGGLICSECSLPYQYAMRLNKGALAIMRKLFEIDYRKLNRLKVSKQTRQNLAKIIPNYLQSIIEKKLQSLDFIRTLNGFEN
jgi:DNA repair protein RecO (recombination protein O)